MRALSNQEIQNISGGTFNLMVDGCHSDDRWKDWIDESISNAKTSFMFGFVSVAALTGVFSHSIPWSITAGMLAGGYGAYNSIVNYDYYPWNIHNLR